MAIRRTLAEFSDDIASADIADNAVTTAKILDANVTTAKIADNQITLAKMAGGTDGQIITYDASGDPVAVGPGTDGQLLTSTGAGSPPAFEAAPASDNASALTSGTLATARMAAGTVIGAFKFKDTSSGVYTTDATVLSIAHAPFSFSATSGRHYIISGSVYVSVYYPNVSSYTLDRWMRIRTYYGTTSRSQADVTLDTALNYYIIGRDMKGTASVTAAYSHASFSYTAYFTAGSTETHYVYSVIQAPNTSIRARMHQDSDSPHYCIIYEVAP